MDVDCRLHRHGLKIVSVRTHSYLRGRWRKFRLSGRFAWANGAAGLRGQDRLIYAVRGRRRFRYSLLPSGPSEFPARRSAQQISFHGIKAGHVSLRACLANWDSGRGQA